MGLSLLCGESVQRFIEHGPPVSSPLDAPAPLPEGGLREVTVEASWGGVR
jgi:hypothetical protein